MAKVNKSAGRGKSKNEDKSGAATAGRPVRTGALAKRGQDREAQSAAIAAAARRGFESHMRDEKTAVVEETGVVDKEQLVGVPFLILAVNVNDGKFQDRFMSVTVLLPTDEVVVFNSGSWKSGVAQQLDGLDISPERPLRVPGGLRASKYDYEDPVTGKSTPAITYYLSGRKKRLELSKNGAGTYASP